jgi:chromosome segregation ATPase
MFMDTSKELVLMIVVGAFILGWVLSFISSKISARRQSKKRDPRDSRIRALEAELRIANSEREQFGEKLEALTRQLEESVESIQKRDNVISHQQSRVEELKRDLKESVGKTRELRHELSQRAEETVRSEVKIREIETELSVAQASTDMIATGVLDYALAPETDGSSANDMIDPADLGVESAKS